MVKCAENGPSKEVQLSWHELESRSQDKVEGKNHSHAICRRNKETGAWFVKVEMKKVKL